jgi:hypothetical protein
MKIPIVIKPEYTLYLEYWDTVYWFHTDVNVWNGRVKRMMLDDLSKMRELVTMPLRALVEAENLKLQKFGDCLGWFIELETTLKDGSKAFVYRWS